MSHENKDLTDKLEALVKINHGWKNDYEKLRTRYEMLDGKNRRNEDKKDKMKVRIKELEKQQTLLEEEISRLALYAQQSSNGGELGVQEQNEILKSRMTAAYEEIFEREKAERENLHEDKEKFKRQLEDAEDIIKQLIAELEALDEPGGGIAEPAGGIAELITDSL